MCVACSESGDLFYLSGREEDGPYGTLVSDRSAAELAEGEAGRV